MIFSQKELRQLHREDRLKIPKVENPKTNSSAAFMSYLISQIGDILKFAQSSTERVFKALNKLDERLDAIQKKSEKPKEIPKKQPEITGFKIIRDMDNRIQKIDVIRSK